MKSFQVAQGVTVTSQGYGAMSLSDAYGPIGDGEARAVLNAALDAGIKMFDTANIYGDGRSETLIGKELLSGRKREDLTVATKFGILRGAGPGHRGVRGDRAYVMAQIDESLRRLKTDYVDIYYVHRVDREVGIEETVGAVAELVRAGKVRSVGLSEASGSEIRRANSIHPISFLQSEWNVFSRDIEANALPAAVDLGITVVPYAPLSRGLLTGRVTSREFASADIRHNFPRFSAEALDHNLGLVEEIRTIARSLDCTPGQVSLAWLSAKAASMSLMSVPIPGTRSPKHLSENVGAIDTDLNDRMMNELDALAARVRGPRNANAKWTSEGRE